MDTIKNINRTKRVQEPYIPEYKRRGLDPIPMGEIPDFASGIDGEILEDFDSVHDEPIKSFTKKSPSPVGDYVLMVNGSVVLHGEENEIIAEIKQYLYTESRQISLDDIIVLRKVNIKVGVFLE